jgi:predicted dehydrogenase
MVGKCLRVGIIGAGKISSDIHIPVLKAMPDVNIEWIADSDTSRSEAVARAFKLEQAPPIPNKLPHADVVLLAIPIPPRKHYIDQLVNTEVAILVEKPLAISAASHAKFLQQFEPWRLSVGYQRRSYATSRFLKRAITEGTFGNVRRITISEGARATSGGGYWGYQDATVTEGGGITLNLGCHSLDLVQWMYSAIGFEVSERHLEWDGETDRRANASFRLFRSLDDPGCIVDWTVSWIDRQVNQLRIECDRHTLSVPIGPSRQIEIGDFSGTKVGILDVGRGLGAEDVDQSFYLEWQSILDGVRNRKACDFTASTSMLTSQLIDAVLAR